MKSHSIIGGMFGLEEMASQNPVTPAWLEKSSLLLSTARSAFTALRLALHPTRVWLPSYLCGVVLRAFPPGTAEICFYPIGTKLKILSDEWLDGVRPGDLTVFIDYFGFTEWHEHAARARERGAWVVEDASQALLNSNHCEDAHYVIYSPRKFVGVPDGGILFQNSSTHFLVNDLPESPSSWWNTAFEASRQRANFDLHGGGREWFALNRIADDAAPIHPTRMSSLSERILRQCIDYAGVSRRRRGNFEVLAEELSEIAIFNRLPDDIVPLGFPVRIHNGDRARVQNLLFSDNIFPPIHWSLANIVPEDFVESHRLSREILTLPCDQRYSPDDMMRMVKSLLSVRALVAD